MNPIVKEIRTKKIKPNTLLLENIKPVAKEAVDFKLNKLDKFGINNTTTKVIKEALNSEKEKVNQQNTIVGKNKVYEILSNMFGVYNIIDYKTLNQIAKDHNLFITGLNRYKKEIPEENIEELELFTSKLIKINTNVNADKLVFNYNNNNFIFLIPGPGDRKKLKKLTFDNCFYIMCPKSHIDIDSKCSAQIGQEINEFDEKPTLSFEIKLNAPEPKDPIILLPFYLGNEIFTVIITAWDKVADDLRIRQML